MDRDPKVEEASTLQEADGFLEAFEAQQELELGAIRLIAIIDERT
jgi:hypothetical protein